MNSRVDPPAGLVLIDKPAGLSSFGALGALRRRYGRRIGHAGTLDPFATGLLLVLIGRATRLQPFLLGLEKEYEAVIRFGARSTTDDPEGEIVPSGVRCDRSAVEATLPRLTGVIEQVPPAASAVHVDGERAYRRFRRGEAVEVPSRLVSVHRFDLIDFDEAEQWARVVVTCGSGTYIRSLARDLGEILGCGAYLEQLRRTRIGTFTVADAVDPEDSRLDEPQGPFWCEPAHAVAHLPRCRLVAETERAATHGRAITAPAGLPDGAVAPIGRRGDLVAVADHDANLLRPRVVIGGQWD